MAVLYEKKGKTAQPGAAGLRLTFNCQDISYDYRSLMILEGYQKQVKEKQWR